FVFEHVIQVPFSTLAEHLERINIEEITSSIKKTWMAVFVFEVPNDLLSKGKDAFLFSDGYDNRRELLTILDRYLLHPIPFDKLVYQNLDALLVVTGL